MSPNTASAKLTGSIYKVLGLYDDLAKEGSVIREEAEGFKVLLDLQKQDRAAAVAALEAIVARIKARWRGLTASLEPEPAIEREHGQQDPARPQHIAEKTRHLDSLLLADRPHHEIGSVADIGQRPHEYGAC